MALMDKSNKTVFSPYLGKYKKRIRTAKNFKWIVSQDVLLSQAPENNIRVILNFSKNRGDIRKSRYTTGINETSGEFCHRYR
jgi:hypothetical protein